MRGGLGDGGLAGLFVEDLGGCGLGVVGDGAGGVFGGVGGHLGGEGVLLAVVVGVADALEGVLGCGAGGLLDVEVAEVELGFGVLGVLGLLGLLGVMGGLGLVLLFVGEVWMLLLLLGMKRRRRCG